MDNTCKNCGAIIPEESHMCINCMPNNRIGCGWENIENCRACRGTTDELADRLRKILRDEDKRIRGD